jgi:ferric-dicitrate binding protein FerR (iron transport regulator)
MMDENDIKRLAEKWMNGSITDPEREVLNQWYQSEYEETIEWHSDQSKDLLKGRLFLNILNGIQEEEVEARPARVVTMRKKWYRVVAVAVVVLAVLAGGYFIYINNQQVDNRQSAGVVKDIPPGGDKAILTLADGKKIVLTDANNGAIASQGEVKVIKMDGLVSYAAEGHADQVMYNTISTPRSGQYQLELADGTKVWLDAESSIRFPNVFKGDERSVELKGQGYFEVAHNAKMPFHVRVDDMDVQVLGTHFNIMAYGNEEAVKTTLLEGSVRVQTLKGAAQSTLLKPGGQAVLGKDNVLTKVDNANIDQAVAWKNGMFQLEGTSVREVLRQIERWYDVDVIVEGNFGDEELSGEFSRKQYVSQLLKILEEAGVGHFRMEGKKYT